LQRGHLDRDRLRADPNTFSIEDAVEAWKASHDDAMEIRDLEEVVREWLGTMDLLAQWQADSWGQLFAGELKRIQDLGRLLRTAYRSSRGESAVCVFFLAIRRPPRSTQSRSSAASDVYEEQTWTTPTGSGYWT